MKTRVLIGAMAISLSAATAQHTAAPQLKLNVVADKESYTVREKVIVKAELKNLTSQTLCFPVPDQECSTPQTGWLMTIGEPVSSADVEHFICHVDGRGAVGAELDSAIKNSWIKLPPDGVYTTKPAEAQVTLSEAGQWKLTATYHPPEGSFRDKYTKLLQSAAQKARCTLPDTVAVAEPKLINVHGADPKTR